jgi:uncharacterized membrane-anchored protein
MRTWLFWGVAVAVLAVGNGLVAHKERVLRTGETMFLKLAPVDPRSLIQGDYMVLSYEMSNAARGRARAQSGCLVVTVDALGIARFVRVHGGEPLGEGERLLRYRNRAWGVRLGAESFFFQEGHARFYEKAKYGEFRVAPSGTSVLAGLRGEGLERLGPPSR